MCANGEEVAVEGTWEGDIMKEWDKKQRKGLENPSQPSIPRGLT